MFYLYCQVNKLGLCEVSENTGIPIEVLWLLYTFPNEDMQLGLTKSSM